MIRGAYVGAMGMLLDMAKLDKIANDLANADTVGYKSDRMAFKTYLENEMYAIVPGSWKTKYVPIGKLEGAVVVDEVRPDMRMGVLERTGNVLDLAIKGDGFFAVDTGKGILYTRAGNFKLDSNGHVVTPDGYKVLDVNGKPILFKEGYRFSEDGVVYDADGNPVTKIAVYVFKNPEKLEKYGYTYFKETEESGKPKKVNVGIAVGYVEKSNVNVVREMVKMINALRHFEISQRVITTTDELLGRLMNSVATLR